jgi:hypothetical protein
LSIESLAACLHHSRASGSDKLVLLGIANHDGDGGAWPSITTLAKYANISERSVQKCVDKLIELNEITRHINKGGNANTRGDRRPNRYEILVRCPQECDGTTRHGVNRSASRGEPDDTHGVNSDASRGEAGFTLTIHKPSLEPSINLSRTFSAEVIELSNLLADLIEANGIKRPAVTDNWLKDMERINLIDGYSYDQIERTIRWTQQDSFWRSNVLSPAKLRKQFGALQLKSNPTSSSGLSGWANVINKLSNQTMEISE